MAGTRSDIREEAVAFDLDGLTLRGTLSRPASVAPAFEGQALLALHGWAGNRSGPQRLLTDLCRDAARDGLNAFRYDLPGRGFSDGPAAATDLDRMIESVLAAKAFLAGRDFTRLHLAGICSGGNLAIGAQTLAADAVASLVCLSTLPFAEPDRARRLRRAGSLAGRYLRKACRLSTWRRLLRGELDLRGAGAVITDAARPETDRSRKDSRRDIPAAFARCRVPALFLYGGADPEAEPARDWYEALCARTGVPARFHVVNGANHNFSALPWAAEARREALAAVREAALDSAPRR